MRKIIIILFALFLLFILTSFFNYNIRFSITNINADKKGITSLNIEKIDLNEIVYEDTIQSKSIKGVVMFKEFGRPDIKNSNTIIGAHSGNGRYSIFTNLDKLKKDDIVYLTYNEIKYKYIVIDVSYVYKTNNKILNNIKEKTTLTLFTCNENNDEYRLIIVLELIDFI